MKRAVIDIGTNSVKLLIAEVAGTDVRPIHEASKQTRLGKGFYETHRLQPDAISATAKAVAGFAAAARESQAASIRIIATSAAREAVNRDELTFVEELRRRHVGIRGIYSIRHAVDDVDEHGRERLPLRRRKLRGKPPAVRGDGCLRIRGVERDRDALAVLRHGAIRVELKVGEWGNPQHRAERWRYFALLYEDAQRIRHT